MKMTDKICNNCGNKVSGTANFCPKCKSTSFRNVYEITRPNNSLVYKLFYNYQDSYFILSKSKIAAILVFLLFMTFVLDSPSIIFFALVIAALVYAIGYSVHRMIGEDRPRVVMENNNYGLITDLKHLFFYWQDKTTGEFEFSKTKTITILVFLLFASIGTLFSKPVLFSLLVFGLLFAAPAFFVGYALHRLSTSEPVKEIMEQAHPEESKREVKVEPVKSIHEFDHYRTRLNELKIMYEIKEKNACKLIEKRFTPPQITYDRFMSSVENSNRMFNLHADAISNILDLASDDSEKVDNEINSRMEILESLVEKMDELVNELVLSLNDDEQKDNVSDFLHDFDYIIDSVKDYQ